MQQTTPVISANDSVDSLTKVSIETINVLIGSAKFQGNFMAYTYLAQYLHLVE